jgi:hypothetical protein
MLPSPNVIASSDTRKALPDACPEQAGLVIPLWPDGESQQFFLDQNIAAVVWAVWGRSGPLWPAPDPDPPVTAAGRLLASDPVRGDVVRGPFEVVLQRRQVGLALPPG